MSEEQATSAGEGEWLVTTCESCKREIKLRDDSDASQLACPYCSAPLDPSGDAADLGASAADPGRVRIKRRGDGKPPEEVPAWDRAPGEEEEKEDEDVAEFVEVDPNNPEGVRVRRVKRKKVDTPGQKFLRTVGISVVSLVAVGGVALLIAALYQGTQTATKDMQEAAELPDRIQQLIAAARSKGIIPTVLTAAEQEAAEEIVRGFLAADGWRNKLPYVYNPERTTPRMQQWYGRPENSDSAIAAGEVARAEKAVIGGRYIIKLAIEVEPAGYKILALRQTPNDIKIDWESSVGYQEMLLSEFKAQRPQSPVPFRAYVQQSDYYNYEFSDEERYQCVELSYPLNPDFRLFAYIDRQNPQLEEMLNSVETGKGFSAIVKVRYLGVSTSADQVEVTELVATPWYE